MKIRRRTAAPPADRQDAVLWVSALNDGLYATNPSGTTTLIGPAAGGGGSSDHATLTNRAWTSSAHTGTASRFAVFDSGGAAAYLAYPTTGLTTWTGTAFGSATVSAPLTYSAGTLAVTKSDATHDGYLSQADWSTFNNKEPAITAGTTGQYWRGDKSWQTLDKAAVGLGSVENTALSTWAGSANIVTVGTVTAGTWRGTAVATGYGGTGLSSYTAGDLVYCSATNVLAKLGIGSSTYLLGVVAGLPAWRSPANAKTDLSLNNVENTALSTWAGTSNITTLGTVATGTWNGTAVAVLYGGTGATTASGARTNLGLAIGTDVQAYDAGLASLTSADATAGLPYVTGANSWATATYAAMLSVVAGAWKVVGWRESGGTDLTNGAIADGQLMARVGTTVAGVNVSATPTASYVVKSGSGGTIDNGWLDADIKALGDNSINGFWARTGSGTGAARTISAGSGVAVTNGDGVSGNPTIAMAGSSNTDWNPTTCVIIGWVVTKGTAITSINGGTVSTTSAPNPTQTSTRMYATFSTGVGTNGANMGYGFYRIGHGGTLYFRFRTGPSLTNSKLWFAAASNGGIGAGSTPAAPLVAIQYDAAIDATNFQIIAYDGTTVSRTSLGVAAATSTEYLCSLRLSATTVYGAIAASIIQPTSLPAEISHNTNLPSTSTDLGPQIGITSTSGTKTYDFHSHYYKSDLT